MSDASAFLWIRDWRPQRFVTPEAMEGALRDRLRRMVGRKLEEIWVVWDLVANEWFCDAPVLLIVDGQQIEVSANKLDELYVSFDAIDRSAPFGWVDNPQLNLDLEWRCNPSFVAGSILGQTVTGFGAGEYAFELANFVGTQPWVLVSLEVELEGGAHLAIENGLDENALRFQSPEERSDFRMKRFDFSSEA